MTNTNAILRKSVFTSIYIIVLIAITYYLYDIFYSIPSSGLIFAVVIFPISIIIFIRKIIQYVIYVLSIYNSDVEFDNYKDAKKVISKNNKKLLKVITIITLIISFTICIYSGFSMLYLKNSFNEELLSQVSLANLSNINCKISDNEIRTTDSVVIWPAKMYKDFSKYNLTDKITKDGDILEREYAHIILYNIQNFPRWYLKVYFNTLYEEMLISEEIVNQQAKILEINNKDYYGYCLQRQNQAEFEILIMNKHDLVYISIGAAQDAVYISSDKVMEIATLLLNN